MKSFVINLDRSPERLEFMASQLSGLGLDWHRVPAIDGNTLDTDERNSSVLELYELACLMSHRKAWQVAFDDGGELSAFFEDDAVLSRSCRQLLNQEDWIPEEVHTIRLETRPNRLVYLERHGAEVGDRKMFRLLSNHHGAAGYILRRAQIPIWLEKTRSLQVAVDEVLFAGDGLARADTAVYQVVPGAVKQRSLDPSEKEDAFKSLLGHAVEFRKAPVAADRVRSGRSAGQNIKRELSKLLEKARQKFYGPVRQRVPFE
ncbi:glycosyltransferase family 25 protein [Thioclava sp. BHET1]|nr:glycosyltransferase family 25 protein [Thioclava sp. BHET1]